MYLGGSLFLLAIGAILAFAVQNSLEGIDLITVGYILMAVGALGLILSLFVADQARRTNEPPRR